MSPENNATVIRRAQQLEWLLLDVDGVLTDGTLYIDKSGESFKAFNVKDGLGIRMAREAGLKVGILSARRSQALERRASQLNIDVLMAGHEDKGATFDRFLDQESTSPSRVAYIGDDLNDLVVLARAGLSFAPADAVPEVQAVVQVVLRCRGGAGAVREMIEHILRARGDWSSALTSFSLEQ